MGVADGKRRTQRAWVVVRGMADEIVEDRISGLAAEVAFFGVLSIFPGLLIIATALGSLNNFVSEDVSSTAEKAIIGFLNRILTDDAAGTINATEQLFARQRGGLLTISILVAVFSMSRGFAAVIRALDLAYEVREQRSWARQRLLALALGAGSVLLTIVVLVMFVAGPLLGSGERIAEFFGVGRALAVFWDWFRWPLVIAVLILWATTLYHLAPNRKTSWSSDLPGALFSGVMWTAVSLGFSLYLRLAASANQVLGVLGGGLILLIWLYLLSFVFLVGAELNSALDARRAAASHARRPRAVLSPQQESAARR